MHQCYKSLQERRWKCTVTDRETKVDCHSFSLFWGDYRIAVCSQHCSTAIVVKSEGKKAPVCEILWRKQTQFGKEKWGWSNVDTSHSFMGKIWCFIWVDQETDRYSIYLKVHNNSLSILTVHSVNKEFYSFFTSTFFFLGLIYFKQKTGIVNGVLILTLTLSLQDVIVVLMCSLKVSSSYVCHVL